MGMVVKTQNLVSMKNVVPERAVSDSSTVGKDDFSKLLEAKKDELNLPSESDSDGKETVKNTDSQPADRESGNAERTERKEDDGKDSDSEPKQDALQQTELEQTLAQMTIVLSESQPVEEHFVGVVKMEAMTAQEQPRIEQPVKAEQPQTEAPVKTELPQIEAPVRAELPQTEAPVKTEQPQIEVSVRAELPQTEAPVKTELPQIEAPAKTEQPQARAGQPQTEASAKTEQPQAAEAVPAQVIRAESLLQEKPADSQISLYEEMSKKQTEAPEIADMADLKVQPLKEQPAQSQDQLKEQQETQTSFRSWTAEEPVILEAKAEVDAIRERITPADETHVIKSPNDQAAQKELLSEMMSQKVSQSSKGEEPGPGAGGQRSQSDMADTDRLKLRELSGRESEEPVSIYSAVDFRLSGQYSDMPTIGYKAGELPLKTTSETLPEDLGKALAARFPENDRTLTVELEPAALGKLTIKLIYEGDRAAVSIMASNPKTLQILNEKASEIAAILEEKTGQQTVIYTHEPQQGSEEQLNQEHHSRQDRDAEEERRQNQQKKESYSESFAHQLRLGLV